MPALRFCLITTFYPPFNFGGDGIDVERTARALVTRGHHVTVVHDTDAYVWLSGSRPSVPPDRRDDVEVVSLRSALGVVSPFLTHQVGRPVIHGRRMARLFQERRFDVVVFNNVSLVGGPGLLSLPTDALKVYIAHEHWLVCPTHVLWRYNREPCETQTCARCVLTYRRPPQVWRYTGMLERHQKSVGLFIARSEFSRRKHHELGFSRPMAVLPYFLPGTLRETFERTTPRPQDRPYFLFVGRLERIKGLDSVLPVFDRYPDADMLVIGDGEQAEALREQSRNAPNVKFLGRIPNEELRRYYEHALALIVPSRGYETFGIVLIEAFRYGTPVIARRIGPFPEIVEQSGGGLLFSNGDELVAAMRRIQGDPEYRARLGRDAFVACRARWSEDVVINRFLEMVSEARTLPVTGLAAEPPETASDAPVFTVIVPTHQRPLYLTRCLEVLAAQDYPRDAYEIIVVDDGGSTEAATVVDRFRAAGLAVRYLSQAQSGPAAARNRAARVARGRYLAFTDDDCAPRKDWLTHLERALTTSPEALVGGLTVNALPAVRYSTASQMLIDYLYEYYHVEQTGSRFFTTNNLAMDAKTFRLLGGFDHTFPLAAAEDREFCERWQRSGRPLLYNEAAVVQHWHLLDFRTFVRQHFNYGRGADFLHRSRARDGGPVRVPKLEPPVFYFNLVTAPLRKVIHWRSISLAGLMLVTQVAYGAGYGFQRIKRVLGNSDNPPSSPTI